MPGPLNNRQTYPGTPTGMRLNHSHYKETVKRMTQSSEQRSESIQKTTKEDPKVKLVSTYLRRGGSPNIAAAFLEGQLSYLPRVQGPSPQKP